MKDLKEGGLSTRNATRGITLIALVITIIVLLILAGVTISILMGENGILTKASESKLETRGAAVEEARDLWMSEKNMDSETGESTAKSLEELINDLLTQNLLTEDEKDIILGNEEKGIEAQYQITIGSHFIDFTTNGTEIDYANLAPGLYETGTTNMIKSWEQLIADADITVQGKTLIGMVPSSIDGDLVISDVIDTLSQYGSSCGDIGYRLTGIYIPGTIREIPYGAFSYFKSLEWVIMCNGIEKISAYAFEGNTKLNSIIIPDTITNIGEGAFASANFENITLPNKLKVIEKNTFRFCTSLQSITIPDKVMNIGYGAFSECTNLQSITIPDKVMNIGYGAFSECTNLQNITFPDSVINLDGYVFDNTLWYNSQPDGDIYIGKIYYGFKGSMPENTEIKIKEGTVGIQEWALSDCTNVTNITIPDTVIWIGQNAFTRTSWYDNQPDGDVYIGKVYYDYKGSMPENTEINIREGTIAIANSAFAFCSELTSITIPNSVISIGNGAFYNSRYLTNITIPNSVERMGEYVFNSWRTTQTINIQFKENEIPEMWSDRWNLDNDGDKIVETNIVYLQ